jgi:FkbM family methyltransferase
MSRGRPARNRAHGWLQEWYRAARLRRFLSLTVSKGQAAFDVGANRGEWTAALRKLGAKVVAVEPQSACVEMLHEQFGADNHVQIVPSAIGEGPGTGLLYPAVTTSEHASMSDEWRRAAIAHREMPPDGWLKPVEVPVTTLDLLIERFGSPVFCKLDVEGLEPEALAGLSQPLPAIAFEFHHEMPDALRRCTERLANLGSYRFRVFEDEWPDPIGEAMPAERVSESVSALPDHVWGLILARLAHL